MKENGSKICSMDEVLKAGRTLHVLLENTEKAARTESENISGQMEQSMKVNGKIMRLQAMVTISGAMAAATSDIGRATSWMISVSILGKTDACTKDSIEMTRNTGMAFIHGQIRKNTQDGGIKVNSTVWESS